MTQGDLNYPEGVRKSAELHHEALGVHCILYCYYSFIIK